MSHFVGHHSARKFIQVTWQSQANLSLFLIMLVVTVFVLPSLNVSSAYRLLAGNVVYSVVAVSGVAIAWGRPRLLAIAALLCTPGMVLRWVTWFYPAPGLQFWGEAAALLSVLTLCYVLLAQVFREGPINAMRVQGAVAVYLLLGVAYACAYQMDYQVNRQAVESTVGQMSNFLDWIYYSFSTLSTLGYGDIVPTSRLSRSLAVAEAITGQMYLAILIARLVSMQVSGAREKER